MYTVYKWRKRQVLLRSFPVWQVLSILATDTPNFGILWRHRRLPAWKEWRVSAYFLNSLKYIYVVCYFTAECNCSVWGSKNKFRSNCRKIWTKLNYLDKNNKRSVRMIFKTTEFGIKHCVYLSTQFWKRDKHTHFSRNFNFEIQLLSSYCS